MAVSRNLRYEVFRRDGFRCRYCGAGPDDAKLTVDHVVPTALGGDDKPENLVTACDTCNGGKAASAPDAPIVANVADDALRWAAAMKQAAQVQGAQRLESNRYVTTFDEYWKEWTVGDEEVPRPADWAQSVRRFFDLGLNTYFLLSAVETAMQSNAYANKKFRYFCGVCWGILRERQEAARAILEAEDQGGADES